MNIQRKVINIELNEKEYDFILDFESAIIFQDLYKKSIFIGLSKLSEEQDLLALSCLIAACLKDEKGKPVGLDFVKKLNLIGTVEYFMDKISALVDNSLPVNEDKPNKKK